MYSDDFSKVNYAAELSAWHRKPIGAQLFRSPSFTYTDENTPKTLFFINFDSGARVARIENSVSSRRRCLFPFRKRSLPFLTVDAITDNQAFSHGRCNI